MSLTLRTQPVTLYSLRWFLYCIPLPLVYHNSRHDAQSPKALVMPFFPSNENQMPFRQLLPFDPGRWRASE